VIRVWVVRDTNTSDPHYAARDAATQALAVELARGSGMDYGLRVEGGYAEAFFTGEGDAALTLLSDLQENDVPVYLIEVNHRTERGQILNVAPLLRGGTIGGAPSEYETDHAERVPVEVVQDFRTGRGKEGAP
jgi:hypothetical protein